MAADSSIRDELRKAPVRAAVLVPVFLHERDWHVVYIERGRDVPTHAGQLAFPGGRYRDGEEGGLLGAALREAHEEIGLAREDVEVITELPEVRTLTSDFSVAPFVGRIAPGYVFQPDPREVARVFAVPLAKLRGRETMQTMRRRLSDGTERDVEAFVIDEGAIWGATERITSALLRTLAR